MFTRLSISILVCISTLGFQAQSCHRTESDPVNRIGSDARADLVFFFKKGVSGDEIFEFHRTVIGNPTGEGTGYSSLPGMMTVANVVVADLEGAAINFKPNATEEQKALVAKRVDESPLVFRVYENVVPDEIKDLPDLREAADANRTPDPRPTRIPKTVVITPRP